MKEYNEINERIDPLSLDDKIEKEKKNVVNHDKKIWKMIIEKYLKILNPEYISSRIANMLALERHETTLLCDTLKEDDREYYRESMLHMSLNILNEKYDIGKDNFPYIDDWDKSIINTLKDKLPVDYRVYYHYNYLSDTSYKINYEITIYRGNPCLFDPWCLIICCYSCGRERNEKYLMS